MGGGSTDMCYNVVTYAGRRARLLEVSVLYVSAAYSTAPSSI